MNTGAIKNWNRDRGFGFAARNDKQADIFIHCRSLIGVTTGYLAEGQRVSFDIGNNERSGKPEAQNVRVIISGTGGLKRVESSG